MKIDLEVTGKQAAAKAVRAVAATPRNSAESLLCALVDCGVDTSSGILAALRCRFTTLCTANRACAMCWSAMNRRQFMLPRAMPGQPVGWVWSWLLPAPV